MGNLDSFIAVATIRRVEKVEQASDIEGNSEDYFLAYGTLQAAYDTHLFSLIAEPKAFGEN